MAAPSIIAIILRILICLNIRPPVVLNNEVVDSIICHFIVFDNNGVNFIRW